MQFAIVRFLTLASVLACTIVIVSFTMFAVGQAEGASERQRAAVLSGVVPVANAGPPAPSTVTTTPRRSAVRRLIDEGADKLTSPFAGLTSPSQGEWMSRGVGLVGALALYGFGLGFLARTLRVRA